MTSRDLERSNSWLVPIRLERNISKTIGSTVGYPSDSLASCQDGDRSSAILKIFKIYNVSHSTVISLVITHNVKIGRSAVELWPKQRIPIWPPAAILNLQEAKLSLG